MNTLGVKFIKYNSVTAFSEMIASANRLSSTVDRVYVIKAGVLGSISCRDIPKAWKRFWRTDPAAWFLVLMGGCSESVRSALH